MRFPGRPPAGRSPVLLVPGRLPGPVNEPIVAFGARMCWSGLYRPGDPFVPPVRTRLVRLTSGAGEPVRRAYGAWSERHRVFTLNLSHPAVRVEPRSRAEEGATGIDALVHWVPSRALSDEGAGSVCHADGWPADLWAEILRATQDRSAKPVAERLRWLAETAHPTEAPIVTQWRELLAERPGSTEPGSPLHGFRGWLPVPVPLEIGETPSTAILSWSPVAAKYRTLSEALETLSGSVRMAGLVGQLRYHAECSLAELHGVRFRAADAIADRKFEGRPEYRAVFDSLHAEELAWVEDPDHGQLDGYDARTPDGEPLSP
jgi:hypothetical protein